MITFYKAHKGDYYCRELPYRIFKSTIFWKVKRVDTLIGCSTKNDVVYYADSLQEAKNYVLSRMSK